MISYNSAFEQGNLDLWRYINAFIIIIIIIIIFIIIHYWVILLHYQAVIKVSGVIIFMLHYQAVNILTGDYYIIRSITLFRRSQYKQVGIIYNSLFSNRVPRRCHNGWNWFRRWLMTLTASGPSVCSCCVINDQLFQVIVDCSGDAL